MQDRIIFVVADSDQEVTTTVSQWLKSAFDGCVVYTATEGSEAYAKIQNTPPRLFVAGLDLGKKLSGIELCQRLTQDKNLMHLPILMLSDVPDAPDFAEDRASGRMKFLSMPLEKAAFLEAARHMVQMESLKSNSFGTRSLKAGEVLFQQGDMADRAFLVKTGKLEAAMQSGKKNIQLGDILAGEFVGEMAHITGEPRSATVKALEDSELIEIPLGTLDLLVFSKPTWTKALLKTLCRRLREANLRQQKAA
jgi:CRP/FNR family cyclic AMP-dependent transcriptional regulator